LVYHRRSEERPTGAIPQGKDRAQVLRAGGGDMMQTMQPWGDEQRVQEYPRQPYSPSHPGIAYGRNFPFPQLAGDRQLCLMPCCHPASEDLHLKAFVSQDPRRSDRAAFCVSHGDDGSCPVRLKLRKSAVQLGQRNKHRPRNVASFPNKLVRVTHIEHKRWGFVSEEYLELLG